MEVKHFIRALWADDPKPLWENVAQREALQKYLNDMGFYVLTGAGDSLEVYALEVYEPADVVFIEKSLDKLSKLWYTMKKGVTK